MIHLPCLDTFALGLERLQDVAWSPDGAALAVGGDTAIAVISPEARPVWRAAARYVARVVWSPDGGWLAAGEAYGHLVMRSAGSSDAIWSEIMPTTIGIEDLAWSRDSTELAAAIGDEHAVLFLEPSTGDERRRLSAGDRWEPVSVAFSPDGRRVATGAVKDAIRIWNADTGAMLVRGPFVGACPWGLAWSPDGRLLAAADLDGSVRICDPADGSVLSSFVTGQKEAHLIDWAPDGRAIVVTSTACADAFLYEAASGAGPRVLSGHRDVVRRAAFSPDGGQIATASFDGTLRLWKV